jgi:hypothetical protein
MTPVLSLMGLAISAPDHTTVSRRAATLPAIQVTSAPHGPLRVLIDSKGLQVYGAGQWLEAKHGAKSRWTWRKLHLAVDAANGMTVAHLNRHHNGPPLPNSLHALDTMYANSFVEGSRSAPIRTLVIPKVRKRFQSIV